jgi:hypothetical protein
MLHRVEAEDGQIDVTSYVGSCYHCFAIFYVLDSMSNLIFSFLFVPINRTLDGCVLFDTSLVLFRIF